MNLDLDVSIWAMEFFFFAWEDVCEKGADCREIKDIMNYVNKLCFTTGLLKKDEYTVDEKILQFGLCSH